MKDKSEILEELKETTRLNGLKLPEHLDLASVDGTLFITLTERGLLANMQTDSSAFEGWAFAIKAVCPEIAKKVVIQWHKPEQSNPHYTRFLYRAIKFEESYENVEIKPLDDKSRDEFEAIKAEMGEWVINYPSSEAKSSAQKLEAQLERAILRHFSEELKWICGNQLPTGLFFKEKSARKEYERTPRNGCQIDLWSLQDDTFTVYELKADDNKMVGIISELMFYVNVIKDINEGIITYPTSAVKGGKFRSFENVLKFLPSNPRLKIEGVFLANELHPLLTCSNKLLEILNANSRSILYRHSVLPVRIDSEISNLNKSVK